MTQSSRPCEGCGNPVPRTRPTGRIARFHAECRPRCAITDCDKFAKARGYCSGHHHRLQRYGDPLAPLAFVRGEGGYDAAHFQVKRYRGKAPEHLCVDCGNRAEQWSYDHNDPNERIDPNPRPSTFSNERAYSRDIWCYSPRCIPCHRSFDRGRVKR